MKKRCYLKRRFRRGASLAMVLVSMTVLAIMGTLFTTIAMRSYEYSYAKLCKQQAYYTATSSVENFYTLITSKPTLFETLLDSLNSAIVGEQKKNDKIDITTVRVMVGSSGGGTATTDADGNVTSVNLATAGFFATYLGDCDLYVRYANAERTELSIEAHATYNGYTETSRAIIARTNKAAEELKKIFDNVFCLQSPITTIVTEQAYGDIYVSQPALPYFLNEGKMIDDLSTSEGAYNKVYKELEKKGSYGDYPETIPGQYVRDQSGKIVTDKSVVGMYNAVLRDRVYGNAQASTSVSSLTGHTKPIDIDGTPLPNGWYNDWAEIYLFSADAGGTVVDGNLYADSRVLIGLLDRNTNNRLYMQVWNDVTKRFDLVYSESSWMYNQSPVFQGSAFGNSSTSGNFEHGFGKSVFFDHQDDNVLDRDISKFRINGHMYLWEDARIENFDSTNTQNALEGIKNNIYAAKDLYIAGIWNTQWTNFAGGVMNDRLQTEREVSIYGDVVVQGNAYIEGATIYGDVYVYGDELRMNDVTVYGNVYFDGQKFTGDRLTVTSGSIHGHACNGGNLIVAGNGNNVDYTNVPEGNTFGTSDDTGNSGVGSDWGAVLMDCDISGTLWSNVNTHVVVSKSERGLVCNNGAWESNAADFYGNIYCSRYLFIDLAMPRDASVVGGARRVNYRANWLSSVKDDYWVAKFAKENNSITVKGEVFAEKLQIRTNQKKWEVGDPAEYLETDISYFGAVYVGGNGLYIDGYDSRNNGSWPEGSGMSGSFPDKWKNIYINSLNHSGSSSNASIWDVCYGSGAKHNSDAVAPKRSDIFGVSDSGAVIPGNLLQSFGANENPLTYKEAVFGSANDDIWENKLITIRSWSAPAHSEKTADLEGGKAIDYVGGAMGGITVANYISPKDNPDYSNALSVSGTTLTIKDSVWFKGDAEGKIDLSAFDKIVLDTSGGNIHIKFDGDVVIGKADAASYHGTANDGLADGTNVVLTGGNMTFWYLYEGKGYNMNNPTLKLNPYTQIGLVQASGNVGRAYDGLYIVSNDDALIYLGKDASLNAFTYAPHGQLFMEPGSAGGANTMNGCMAIESLILISDADADDSTWWDKVENWWNSMTGGQVGDDIEDAVVGQYQESNYHYVQPPLIVDFGFSYGDIESEIKDYGQVIWAFLGYY